MASRLVNLNFPLKPETIRKLEDRYQELNLSEQELEEKFVRGSGKGGQKVNKTNNCVVLTHTPSNISVSCHKDRSLILNRFFARRLICDAIELKNNGEVSKKDNKTEKIKKQKARRKRKTKNKLNNENKK